MFCISGASCWDITTISAGRLAVRSTARELGYSRLFGSYREHIRLRSGFLVPSIGGLGGAEHTATVFSCEDSALRVDI